MRENNIAYIDGANLHRGILSAGWRIDHRRFRVWLSDKYSVQTAYIFLGLIPKYKELYTKLQEAGFTLVFKEVVYDRNGKAKGNCDADLVLRATRDFYENKFDKAILVSSDGDYGGMVSFFLEHKKFYVVLSPNNRPDCSVLLRRTGAKIAYLQDQKKLLSYK